VVLQRPGFIRGRADARYGAGERGDETTGVAVGWNSYSRIFVRAPGAGEDLINFILRTYTADRISVAANHRNINVLGPHRKINLIALEGHDRERDPA
jgi:hypothetical protein